MGRGCVLLLFLGSIICVNASYHTLKPKVQTVELKDEGEHACNLNDFETPFINCEGFNPHQGSVPHGKRCTFEDDIDTGATADFICDNGHWSGTDYTVGESRQKRWGLIPAIVVGAVICYYLCPGIGGKEEEIKYPPEFPSDCRPRDLLNKYNIEPGQDSIVVYWTAPTATDKNGDTPSVKQIYGINNGGRFPGSAAGTTHYIRYEAEDKDGLADSCYFNFSVYGPRAEEELKYPPEFPSDCRPRDLLDKYYIEPGQDSIVVDWTVPTATDKNGDSPRVEQTKGIKKGGQFPGSVAGTIHYIQYQAEDKDGLTDCCYFHFIVYKTVYHPPEFPSNCRPRDLRYEYNVEPGQDSIVVTWTAPTATDKNGDTPSVKQTHGINNGGRFPGSVAGKTHNIRYEAKDSDGLTDSCIFQFIVYVRTCDPPVWPENGYRRCDDGDYVIGSQCQYSCHDGYTLKGDNIVRCQTSLRWSDVPKCERVSCDPPGPLVNGAVSCNNNVLYSYGTVCVRSCNQGFDLRGQLFTQCQADGSWFPFAETTCIDNSPPSISCKSPQVFYADRNSHSTSVTWEVPIASDNTDPNPDVIQTSGPSMNDILNVGSEYVSYIAVDKDNIASQECTIELQVKEITCGHPKGTLQDKLLYTECSDAEYRYGVQCNVSCVFNLPLNGTDVITCERNGTTGVWSWGNDYMPYCIDISCPDLDPPSNGAIVYDSVQRRSAIVMLCNDNFSIPSKIGNISFSGLLLCLDKKGWTPFNYVPECVKDTIPRFLRLKGYVYYYSGDCGSNETMEEIRLKYQDIIKSGNNSLLTAICSYSTCTANIVIQCGPIQNRRRRSTRQSLNNKATINVERMKRSINSKDNSPHDVVKRQANSHVLVVEIEILMTMTILANESLVSKIGYYDGIMSELVAAVKAFLNNGSLDIANFTTDVTSWQPPDYGEIECDPGYLLDRDTCKPCPAGHYLNETYVTCIKCPIGQYYGGEGSTECVECPIGYTTKQDGSKYFDNCTEICHPGSASPDGMLPCAVCLYGEYQDEYGQTSCKQCPSGTTTNNTNTTSSQDCQGYDILIEETAGPVSLANLQPDFTDVSLSFWAKRFNEQAVSIILQLKTGENDALIVYLTENVRIHIPDQVNETVAVLSSTTWTNVLVTLSSSDNSVQVFINGNQEYTSTVSISAPVITNGEIILTASGSSGLYMTGLHVLDKIVDASEITTYASLCHVIQTEDIIDMGVFQNIDTTGITVLSSSSCDVDDNCDPDPCNGHRCIDGQNRFTCLCSSGWSGDNCTVPPDYCIDNSCENGATCVSHTTNYTCGCLPGFTGSMCEVPPVDGSWSEWTITTPCSKQCGTGNQSRTRLCNSPSPDPYGNNCAGESKDTIPCNTQACLVCKEFELKAGTMTNCTTDADTGDQLCTVYCEVGKIMEPGYPNTVNYICGPSSLYEWNATELIPSCVEPSAPTKLTISSTVQFNQSVLESDMPALIASIKSNFKSTNCSNKCEVSVEISDNGIATISYSIELTEGHNLDYITYVSTGQVSPSLHELVYSISQLELTAQQVENFTSDLLDANINGQSYTVVASSLLTQGVVHCPDGQTSYDGACIYCPPGTYSDNGNCKNCAKGSYQPSEGQSSCIQCPTGLTTVTVRSTDLSKCSEPITTTTSPAKTRIPEDEPDKSNDVIIIVAVVLSIVVLIIVCLAIGCVWYKKCRKSSSMNVSVDDLRYENSKPPTDHYLRDPPNLGYPPRPKTALSVSGIFADIENGSDTVSQSTLCPPNDYLKLWN